MHNSRARKCGKLRRHRESVQSLSIQQREYHKAIVCFVLGDFYLVAIQSLPQHFRLTITIVLSCQHNSTITTKQCVTIGLSHWKADGSDKSKRQIFPRRTGNAFLASNDYVALQAVQNISAMTEATYLPPHTTWYDSFMLRRNSLLDNLEFNSETWRRIACWLDTMYI